MEARVASRPSATIFLDLLMSRCWPDVVFIDIWPARLWLGTPYKDSCPGLEFTFLYILCISITADYKRRACCGLSAPFPRTQTMSGCLDGVQEHGYISGELH